MVTCLRDLDLWVGTVWPRLVDCWDWPEWRCLREWCWSRTFLRSDETCSGALAWVLWSSLMMIQHCWEICWHHLSSLHSLLHHLLHSAAVSLLCCSGLPVHSVMMYQSYLCHSVHSVHPVHPVHSAAAASESWEATQEEESGWQSSVTRFLTLVSDVWCWDCCSANLHKKNIKCQLHNKSFIEAIRHVDHTVKFNSGTLKLSRHLPCWNEYENKKYKYKKYNFRMWY